MGIFSARSIWGHHKPHRTTGFSLVEILVASSIAAIFGALVFQGIALASTIQAQAIQRAEAAGWVRDDIENLQRQAADLAFSAKLCLPTTAEKGWAAALEQSLPAPASSNGADGFTQVSTTGRTFQITRQTEIGAQPYNILSLSYQVQPIDGIGSSAPIYQFYTEVIPDAAFQCP